jgi:hypothetical protein
MAHLCKAEFQQKDSCKPLYGELFKKEQLYLHCIKKKWSNLAHKVRLGASILEAISSNPGQDTGTRWTNAEYLKTGLE